MEKLKVGLFIDTFYPMVDGVIQVVDQYAQRLCKFCDVTVFTVQARKKKQDTIAHPYKVVRCKVMPVVGVDYDLALPAFDKEFKKELENANLDIVHIHSPFTIGKCGVKYAKKHNIPVIATMHSQFKQDFYKATHLKGLTNIMVSIIMKTFNKCDRCFAVNQRVAELFYHDYHAKVMPSTLLNGTDFMPIQNEEETINMVNEKFNLKKDVPLLLFVGRLTTLKNILFIADVLKILKDKGIKFQMLYVGAGQDEDKLREKIKKLGLENEAKLTGKIMDRDILRALYLRTKLFLFPSFYDTNGLVQIEAASQKTPTIFIEGTVASSTVTKDVNGFMAENSVEAFANEIERILNDNALYETVSQNAFEQIYKSWDDCVQDAYKIYLEYIEKKKKEIEEKKLKKSKK